MLPFVDCTRVGISEICKVVNISEVVSGSDVDMIIVGSSDVLNGSSIGVVSNCVDVSNTVDVGWVEIKVDVVDLWIIIVGFSGVGFGASDDENRIVVTDGVEVNDVVGNKVVMMIVVGTEENIGVNWVASLLVKVTLLWVDVAVVVISVGNKEGNIIFGVDFTNVDVGADVEPLKVVVNSDIEDRLSVDTSTCSCEDILGSVVKMTDKVIKVGISELIDDEVVA